MKSTAAILVALASLGISGRQEARIDNLSFQETAQNLPLPPRLPPPLKKPPQPPMMPKAKQADPFIDPALDQLGVYVTRAVADSYRRTLASEFSKGAKNAGFSAQETGVLSASIATGNLRLSTSDTGGYTTSGDQVVFPANPQSSKGSYLLSFATIAKVTEFLERYSTIKLTVTPAPPRDYKVVVNGEECPATETGIYKVMPGESVINAIRPTKPKCEWRGPIAPGATQEVNCSL